MTTGWILKTILYGHFAAQRRNPADHSSSVIIRQTVLAVSLGILFLLSLFNWRHLRVKVSVRPVLWFMTKYL